MHSHFTQFPLNRAQARLSPLPSPLLTWVWAHLSWGQTTRCFCLLKWSLCQIRRLKSHKFLPCRGWEIWEITCCSPIVIVYSSNSLIFFQISFSSCLYMLSVRPNATTFPLKEPSCCGMLCNSSPILYITSYLFLLTEDTSSIAQWLLLSEK